MGLDKQLKGNTMPAMGKEDLTKVDVPVVAPEPGPVPGVSATDGAPAAPVSVAEAAEITLSPEVERLVNERMETLRSEYEGKGGHLAKIKSEYDKKLAEKERRLRDLEAGRIRAIQERAQENPAEAGAMALSQLEEIQQQEQRKAARESWALFARQAYEHYGFSLDDKETADEVMTQGEELFEQMAAGADPGGLALEFQKSVSAKALERVRLENSTLKKQLDSLPEMVEQAVAQALTARGASPEITAVPTGLHGAPGLGASELIRQGIRAGRKEVPINRSR